jgi:quercetin dioxygenase-like cupin family protein
MVPMTAKPKLVPPGAGKTLHSLVDAVTSLVVGADTGVAYAVQQQETQPGGGPLLHRRSREDEGFTVLAGEYQFWVGEQTFRAGPGTFAFGPRGITHTFKCLGPGPGKIQVIISPPGFEAFFVEVDELVRRGAARPGPGRRPGQEVRRRNVRSPAGVGRAIEFHAARPATIPS